MDMTNYTLKSDLCVIRFCRGVTASSIELHTKTLRETVFLALSCVGTTVRNVTANSPILPPLAVWMLEDKPGYVSGFTPFGLWNF